MTNIKKSFCSVPFVEPYINTFGAFGLCCIEKDLDKNPRTFINQDFNEHWNGEYLRNTRKAMLSGKLPPQCHVCTKHEQVGKQSVRQRRNLRYFGEEEPTDSNSEVKKILEKTSEQGELNISIQPKGLLFSTGRLCQLGCVSCSSTYSSFLEAEFQKIGWNEGFKDKKYPQNVQEKLSQKEIDEVLYEHLKKNINIISFLQVTGGEPLINKKFLDFLDWCVENEHSTRIVILITTNGMNIQKERLGILKKFKYSIISFSIDGYGALDEYIRYPTKWDHKVKNMFWLKENVNEFIVSSVVYNLNVLGLYTLTEWLEQNNIKHLFYPLEEPSFLHCKNLPIELKKIATERVEKIKKFSNINIEGVDSILNSLSKNISQNDWEKTKKQISVYKTYRALDILNCSKEFKKFI